MNDESNKNQRDGEIGRPFSGTSVLDSLEYARGKKDGERGGAGMLVAIVMLSPFICLTYPFIGLATVSTGLLVRRAGPWSE